MIKRWLRKWLGVEALERRVDRIDPTHHINRGEPIHIPNLTKPESGALKSMTPLERSQEESKEVRERIEELIK